MKHQTRRSIWVGLTVVALVLSACGGNPAASSPPVPSASAPTQPTQTAAPRATSAQPTNSGTPAGASTARAEPVSNLPPWWPKDLAMPQGTVLQSDIQGNASWENTDPNRDGIATFLFNEGKTASYNVYDLKDDIGHTLYFFKGVKAYYAGVLRVQIVGNEIGGIHVKTAGAVNSEYDAPLPQGTTFQHSGGFDLRGLMRGVPSKDANTSVALFMDAYPGPGTYHDARAEVIPGAAPSKEDYKSGTCTLVIKDDLSGTFDCRGMQNAYDASKKLDASGTWRLPPGSSPQAVRPTETPEPETTAVTVTPAAPVAAKTVKLKYQVNLSGAFALSGTFDYIVQPDDACRVGVGSPTLLTLVDARIAGHQLGFAAHAANLNSLFPAAGTYQLDPNNKSVVFIDNGAQQFESANVSRGSVRLNADGSGVFDLQDFVDALGGQKRESGTIAWTCSQ